MSRFFKGWIWKMALRDGRRGAHRLLLALGCVILGVAATVAVASFSKNLEDAVERQSKTLLGADLALRSRQPFTAEAEEYFRSLGGEQARQVSFASMAYFPGTGKSRLVQVRGIEGGFPYYGALETEPAVAARELQNGLNALADETLMIQFNVGLGDKIRVGEQDFTIVGKLRKIPGESFAFSLVSPRVYIPYAALDRTALLQKGSIVRYRVYFKLDQAVDVERIVRDEEERFTRLGLRADTVSRRKAAIGRSTENLTRFLQLAGFIALLLAGVGVASGIHVYVKEKTNTVALLRCLGARASETVAVYVIQALAIGIAGALLGALLGRALQTGIPAALKDFLPFSVVPAFAPGGIITGLAIGIGTALFFALLPLLPLRRVAPLLALRVHYENARIGRDPLLWANGALIVAAVFGFAIYHTESWEYALWFTLGVAGALALLAASALAVSTVVRKLLPASWPYEWRQGFANLYRPNNQTTAVTLALGLGTFLLVTLYLTQKMLLQQLELRGGANNPNLVLFDVQPDQREGVARLLESFRLPRSAEVPVVTMRLARVQGKPVEELRRASRSGERDWALRREYRSTYRGALADTERLVAGIWHPRSDPEAEAIPVSVEKEIAETLGVAIGDELVFDVQGVRLATRVASLREVDWQRVQPNFFVVFPEGVLEPAPQFYVLVTRADTSALSARVQRAVVEKFPNISVLDITLILATVDQVLGRVSYAISYIALFTIFMGLVVLAGAVIGSRSQRLKESILLRTLGAPRAQITKIIVAEYFFLGAISSLTGTLLAIAASWGLSFYFWGAVPTVPLAPVLTTLAVITALTVMAGVLSCYGVLGRPTLEALRAES